MRKRRCGEDGHGISFNLPKPARCRKPIGQRRIVLRYCRRDLVLIGVGRKIERLTNSVSSNASDATCRAAAVSAIRSISSHTRGFRFAPWARWSSSAIHRGRNSSMSASTLTWQRAFFCAPRISMTRQSSGLPRKPSANIPKPRETGAMASTRAMFRLISPKHEREFEPHSSAQNTELSMIGQ